MLRILAINPIPLLTGVVFFSIGVWMLWEQKHIGWLILAFGSIVTTHNGLRMLHEFRSRRKARAEEHDRSGRLDRFRTWASESTFSLPNDPVATWKAVLSEDVIDWAVFEDGIPLMSGNAVQTAKSPLGIDKDVAWAVFEHGTLVICDDDATPKDSAHRILDNCDIDRLDEYDPDYDVHLAPKFGLWIVSYPDERFYSFTRVADDIDGDRARYGAILEQLELDVAEQNIIHTHVSD